MIRRIDPLGRGAYGVLCIAGMAALALPVLAVAGVVGGIAYALDGDGAKALAVGLGAWGAAAFAAALFFAIAYTAWPLASDWITEWPGYAVGFVIGGIGLALMALLIFLVPLPLYVAVIAPLALTFGLGFAVPGRLIGLKGGGPLGRERARVGRRR